MPEFLLLFYLQLPTHIPLLPLHPFCLPILPSLAPGLPGNSPRSERQLHLPSAHCGGAVTGWAEGGQPPGGEPPGRPRPYPVLSRPRGRKSRRSGKGRGSTPPPSAISAVEDRLHMSCLNAGAGAGSGDQRRQDATRAGVLVGPEPWAAAAGPGVRGKRGARVPGAAGNTKRARRAAQANEADGGTGA